VRVERRAQRMPSARTATAPPRRQTSRKAIPRARRVASRGLRGRVRWDRVGRGSLLVVLGVVASLYVQRALAYVSVRSQADQQRAIVHQLVRSNASLRAQQQSLGEAETILSDARALGMVRPGEHPYEVTGLPGR
jgi:cell division protein FtsB